MDRALAPVVAPGDVQLDALLCESPHDELGVDRDLWELLAAEDSPRSVATTTVASQRSSRRESERKSRQRRQEMLGAMREQISTLECAIAAATPDANGDIVCVTLPAMQDYLRRSKALADEAVKLRAQNQELGRMVQKREASLRELRKLTNGMVVDQWELDAERWYETTMAAFTPWSLEACAEVVRESMKRIEQHRLGSGPYVTTGLSFMGWRDRRRLDASTGTLYFSFSKRYSGVVDVHSIAQFYWAILGEGTDSNVSLLSPSVTSFDKVIQRVSRNISILRCVEKYPGVDFKAHMLMMVFRVRSSTGFVVCVRSIPSPEVQRATVDDDAYWVSNFYWVRMDVLKWSESQQALEWTMTITGTLASDQTEYANRWMTDALAAVIRAESKVLGTGLLKL